ncbi:MAG: hypothetical protein QOJ11_1861 [Frankiales bacterium]|jgi:heat shock protein HslJ|nr:hypothetical protein [Frankiales bacterium]
MSDDPVRDKVRLYAAAVTPAQLPSFGGVAVRRRRRRVRQALAATSSVVVVALVVVFAALASQTSATRVAGPSGSLESQLVGPTWTLVSVTDNGAVWQVPAGKQWTLTLTKTTFRGNDSCNSISGRVSLEGPTVTLGAGSMTEIGCVGADSQRLQQAFQALESSPAKAIVAGTTLTLTVGSKVLTLASSGQVSATPSVADDADVKLESLLTGNSWLLQSITSGGVTWIDPGSTIEQQQAALVFGPHGYRINPDCNDHSGAVSYAGGKLIMRAFMQTVMACPAADVVQAKSAHVADALFSGRITYVHQGNSLVLSNSETSIKFTAGPKPKTPLGVDLPPASGVPSTPVSQTSVTPRLDLQTQLVGPKWLLESWSVGGKTSQARAGPRGPWLQFSPDGVLAEDGCNSHSAPVTYQASTVRATKSLGSTMALCAGDPLAIQDAYDNLFAHTIAVYVYDDGQRLTLSGDNLALSLHRDTGVQLSPMALSLVRSPWKLQSVKAAGVDWHAITGSHATLTLTTWGYQTSDGCSSQGSDLAFDSSGRVLTFGGAESSSGMCAYAAPGPAPGLLPPGDYFKALNGKVTVALSGTTLTLTSGGTVLTFAR